ncbi:MAG: membrane protein insertion efficiency factor YidD [Anaerolineales bacterium]
MSAHQAEAVSKPEHAHDHAGEDLGFEHEHEFDRDAHDAHDGYEHRDHHEYETALRDIPITPSNLPRLAGLGLIRIYQMTLSKAIPSGTCRFYPTCSHYSFQAIVKHGLAKGSGLAVWRVARCQPFSKGGYDPVP